MAIYYISNTGSDTAGIPDNINLPFKTITAALADISADGDTVLLNKGDRFFENVTIPYNLNISSYGTGEMPIWSGNNVYLLNSTSNTEYDTIGIGRDPNKNTTLKDGLFLTGGLTNWAVDGSGWSAVTDHPAGSNTTNSAKCTFVSGTTRIRQNWNLAKNQLYELSYSAYTTNGGKLEVNSTNLADTITDGEYKTWTATADLSALTISSNTDSWVTKTAYIRCDSTSRASEFRFDVSTSSVGGIVYITNIRMKPLFTTSNNISTIGWNITNCGSGPLFLGEEPLRQFSLPLKSITIANPTEIRCNRKLGLDIGTTFSVTIASSSGITPNINGTYTGTVTALDSFTIPIEVTAATNAKATITSENVNSYNRFSVNVDTGNAQAYYSIYGYEPSKQLWKTQTLGSGSVVDGNTKNITISNIHFLGSSSLFCIDTYNSSNSSITGCKFENIIRLGRIYNTTFAHNTCSSIIDYGLVCGNYVNINNNIFKDIVLVTEEGGALWWAEGDCKSSIISNNKIINCEIYGIAWQGQVNTNNNIISNNIIKETPIGIWDQSLTGTSINNTVENNLFINPTKLLYSLYSGTTEIIPYNENVAFLCYRSDNNTSFKHNTIDGYTHVIGFAIAPNAYIFEKNVFNNITDDYFIIKSSDSTWNNNSFSNNIYSTDGIFKWWGGSSFDSINFSSWKTNMESNAILGDPELNEYAIPSIFSPVIGFFNSYKTDPYGRAKSKQVLGAIAPLIITSKVRR